MSYMRLKHRLLPRLGRDLHVSLAQQWGGHLGVLVHRAHSVDHKLGLQPASTAAAHTPADTQAAAGVSGVCPASVQAASKWVWCVVAAELACLLRVQVQGAGVEQHGLRMWPHVVMRASPVGQRTSGATSGTCWQAASSLGPAALWMAAQRRHTRKAVSVVCWGGLTIELELCPGRAM